MAPAPNFGGFLVFGHPFLTEVDFSQIDRIWRYGRFNFLMGYPHRAAAHCRL